MRIVMFVTNAVTHDARVLREADTLASAGHEVTIVGRPERGVIETIVRPHGPIQIILVPTPPAAMRRWRHLRERPWSLAADLARDVVRALRPGSGRWQAALLSGAALLIVAPWAGLGLLLRPLRGSGRQRRPDSLDRVAAWSFGHASWARAAAGAVEGADVWHGHDLSGAIAAERAQRQRHGGLVYDSHEIFLETSGNASLPGWAKWPLRRAERRILARADALVTVNRAVERDLSDWYRIPRRTAIVHNCPPRPTADSVAASPLRSAIGVGAETPVALYHGALTPVRGLRELLVAIRDPRLEGVHLVFLGSGPLEDELRSASADPALAGRVHVLPPVPPDELVTWVTGADVGLMPNQPTTRNELASTPNKLFESISAGIPVVTSDFPERRRIVLDDPAGPLGEVCDPTDPADIARAIHSLISGGPDVRAERRQRCLRAADERWNWETEGAKLIALYASLDVRPGSSTSGSETAAS